MTALKAMRPTIWLFIIALLAIAVPAQLAFAQDAEQAAGKAERVYKDLDASIEKLRTDLQSVAIKDKELEEKRAELEKLRTEALAAQAEVEQPLADAQAQLQKLGAAPPDGKTEAQSITDERKLLGDRIARLEAASKQLGRLVLVAQQLSSQAGERQRQAFVNRIFEGSRSVLNPLLWYDGVAALPTFVSRATSLITSWQAFDETNRTRGFWYVSTILAVSLLGIVLLWFGWLRSSPDAPAQNDTLRRMWRAIRVSVLSCLLLLIAGIVINLVAEMPPRSERLVTAIWEALLFAATTIALVRGIFRPGRPELRLVNLNAAGAMQAFQLVSLAIVVASAGRIIDAVAGITFLPVEFSIAWRAGAAILLTIILASLLVAVRRSGNLEDDDSAASGRVFYFGWTRYLFHAGWLLVLIAVIALLTGHVALAHYMTTRALVTGSLVVFLVMVHHMIDALVRSGLDADSFLGKFLRDTISLGDKAISRFGLLLSALTDMTLFLIGIPLVLLQWTLTWADFRGWLTTAFFGFKVGDITIEPSSIMLAVMVLVIGLLATRLFSTWLERRVLAQTAIDSGVRNSIRTGASYAGILLAGGLALTSAGLDFDNLAIVVGALGVGIGFGLQSIVNNFVSGLILLAERPIKVGDWVQTSGGEGIVKRINVRSTEIETFDRCSVIVPNSTLISESVSNWYHGDVLGRTKVSVGVSYGSDPKQVEQILLDCARRCDHVMPFPEPSVLFTNFGDNSLDFQVRAFIDDVAWVAFVASDLRFKIFEAFAAAGIEIPFPQRDLHVRTMPERAIPIPAAKRPAAKKPARKKPARKTS
ncbi:MAG: mechanosensitive ion channel family protein [Rhizobiales bacterium]|nr:mechanosensitive ion channel family protein [Hyphomicrobiales bacterium]